MNYGKLPTPLWGIFDRDRLMLFERQAPLFYLRKAAVCYAIEHGISLRRIDVRRVRLIKPRKRR